MSKIVWKFKLEVEALNRLQMPEDAQVLHLGMQGVPCLWALCDSEAPLEERVFETYCTGHNILFSENKRYVGTYFYEAIVFHVFETV